MESTETRALVRLALRRFQSFSEATEAVLGALAEVVPGTLMVGRLDPDERICRVIDVRGESLNGMRRGIGLPLASAPAAENGSHPRPAAASPEGDLDGEYLRGLGVKTWLAMPLEMSDGSIAGNLCAFAADNDSYRADHAAVVGVAARMLSYEWESVSRRAELQRLRDQVRDGATTDPDTGLANRETFLARLDREWQLAKRGTVESVLVACRLTVPTEDAVGKPVATLALKDAAEVLRATVRATDHAGRIGDATLAAVLIGSDEAGAKAFLARFESALARVTHSRPFTVDLESAAQPLADAPSAAEALARANAGPVVAREGSG